MAYGRYSRRTRRSRKRFRRGRKSLSTARICSNTSAKAQARQILALRKRINYISRRDKPEIKQYSWLLNDYGFTNEADSSGYDVQWLPNIGQGLTDAQMVGNKIRILNARLTGQFQYHCNSLSGNDTTDAAGGSVRIIVLRNKQSNGYNTAFTPPDILRYGTTSGSSSLYQMQTTSPFRDGISTMYNIALDYKFTLSTWRNQKLINLNIPLVGGRTVSSMVSTSAQLGSPNNWFAIMVVTSGLPWQSSGATEYITGNMALKMAWTDA